MGEAPVGCPALVGLLAGVCPVGFICLVTSPYLKHLKHWFWLLRICRFNKRLETILKYTKGLYKTKNPETSESGHSRAKHADPAPECCVAWSRQVITSLGFRLRNGRDGLAVLWGSCNFQTWAV